MPKGNFWPWSNTLGSPSPASFSTPHSSCPPSHSFLYKGCLPQCIDTLNLNIVKKILRVLIVGLILSVWVLQVATLSPLILEYLLFQMAWHPFSSIIFLHPFLILSSFLCLPFPFLFTIPCLSFNFGYYLSFLILCSFHFHHLCSWS